MKRITGDIDFLATISAGQNESPYRRFSKVVLEQAAWIYDQDINNRLLKELIMRYVKAEGAMRELNEQKNRFLGIASHDLRNPLASIRGFTELLIEGGINEATRQEFLQTIFRVTDEMLNLLNDLLDVSIIESGRVVLSRQVEDISALLKERVAMFASAAGKKRIRLECHAPSRIPANVDRARIAQVVDNFVSNALKYSPPGTLVEATVQEKGGNVEISVHDEGPGISEEDQKRLFGEFQKLSSVPTGGEKATGLGLFIVKKIVEAHGGTVGVQCSPGKGSRFFFMVPVWV